MSLFWNLIWRMDRWDQRKYFIPWTWSNPNKNIIEELQLLNNLHFLNEIYLLSIFVLKNFWNLLIHFFIGSGRSLYRFIVPSQKETLTKHFFPRTVKENRLNMRKNTLVYPVLLWSVCTTVGIHSSLHSIKATQMQRCALHRTSDDIAINLLYI